MPLGDQSGYATMLMITCTAREDIESGDPVALIENYMVTNKEGKLFGQARASARQGETLPVNIRGILSFERKNLATNPGKVPRWAIKNSKLIPLISGEELNILYTDSKRMDILI